MKTRGAHRVYRRRDVELAMLVKRMLHDEGLTIAGAKRRLRELRERETAPAARATRRVRAARSKPRRSVGVRADMLAIRRDALRSLLKSARHGDRAARHARRRGELTATVTASVPSSVPLPRASLRRRFDAIASPASGRTVYGPVAPFTGGSGRGVAQPGSALDWGSSGRWFESSRPDQSFRRGAPIEAPRFVFWP